MNIREEYENLKQELFVKLSDVTPNCNLDLPFEITIPNSDQERYFPRGSSARLATKKTFIILDNTYKKVRLFPGEDIVGLFLETLDEILVDWLCDTMSAFRNEKSFFKDVNEPEMENYLKKLRDRVKTELKPYVDALANLKPEDINLELKSKSVELETINSTNFQFNPDSKDGLF